MVQNILVEKSLTTVRTPLIATLARSRPVGLLLFLDWQKEAGGAVHGVTASLLPLNLLVFVVPRKRSYFRLLLGSG